jgi:hypothetical protein
MERAVESLIAQPLAKIILKGNEAAGCAVVAHAVGNDVKFDFA